MRTKNVLLIRRIEKKVDEDGSREGYLGEEWGENDGGIYRKYLFLKEVSRVEVRREKEDKEHIEIERSVQEKRGDRSSVYREKIEGSRPRLRVSRRLSRTSTSRAIDSKHFVKLRSTPLTANSSAAAQRGVTRNASSITRVLSSRDIGVSKTFSRRLHSLSLFIEYFRNQY